HLLEEIASTFTSNIRELEGALIRLHAFSSLTGQSLDRRTVSSVLLPAGSRTEKPILTVETVIQAVAREYRLESGQLKSSKRSQDLTLPRHIAMYLAYEMVNLSFPRIGEAFGNRKHTSAIYAHSRIKELLITDRDVSAAISRIKSNLEN
ncbi:MAG: chromosomal replication initiator protein DnaA, partial [Cyanobacteria bacterium]|nr:chromosomal replication initiator protein DnaA [Cyanobacteriota bacterium]